MQGFIVFDYAKEYGTARAQLAQWLGEGKLKRKETIVKGGVAAAEEAFQQLFQGGNIGKRKTRPWIDTEKNQSRLTTEQASSWSRSRTQMRYRGFKGLSRSTRHLVTMNASTRSAKELPLSPECPKFVKHAGARTTGRSLARTTTSALLT
jgi:hypothetical protein